MLNFSILIHIQIELLPQTFLLTFISKADFRYFQIINVSKAIQTNFRPMVTNNSPKPWSWEEPQKSIQAGKMKHLYNYNSAYPIEDTVQLFSRLCSYALGLIYFSFTLIWKLMILLFWDSDWVQQFEIFRHYIFLISVLAW